MMTSFKMQLTQTVADAGISIRPTSGANVAGFEKLRIEKLACPGREGESDRTLKMLKTWSHHD